MMIWPPSTTTSPSPPKSVTFQPASELPSKSDCQPPGAAGSSARKQQTKSPNVNASEVRMRLLLIVVLQFVLCRSICNFNRQSTPSASAETNLHTLSHPFQSPLLARNRAGGELWSGWHE